MSTDTLEKCSYRSEDDGWVFDIEDPFTGKLQYSIKRYDAVPLDSPKYLQPKGTKPYPYFSRLIDWDLVSKDLSKDIIITEGAKKADALNQQGFTAISLQGTYGWSHKKKMLKSLLSFVKPGRNIYICFDSDQLENKQVAQAVLELADEVFHNKYSNQTLLKRPRFDQFLSKISDISKFINSRRNVFTVCAIVMY